MHRVGVHSSATGVGLGVALLVGATLLGPVESQGAVSATKICPFVVNQTCATTADCGGAVSPGGIGAVSCDTTTHRCTVQCATTFSNIDVTSAVVNVFVA